MHIVSAIIEHAIFHSGSGSFGSGFTFIGAFPDYATLNTSSPPAANPNRLAYVSNTTGSIGINRRVRGYYVSDGASWNVFEADQQAIDALASHEAVYSHPSFVNSTQVDSFIDNLAIINKHRRGYNATLAALPAYSVLQLAGGETSGYPHVVGCDLSAPVLGVNTGAILPGAGARIVHDGLLQLPPGILDTTLQPLLSPVYADGAAGMSLAFSGAIIGYTLDQSTHPRIWVSIERVQQYFEAAFTSILAQNFTHGFGRLCNVTILDTLRRDITSGVVVTQSSDGNSVLIEANKPVSGRILVTGG